MEKDNVEDLGVAGRTILMWIFNKCTGEAQIGLIWLRIGTNAKHLRMQ